MKPLNEKTAKLIKKSTKEDLVLVHYGEHRVWKQIAAPKSTRIVQALHEDPLCEKLQVTAGKGPFKTIVDFLNGEPVNVPSEDVLFALDVANELGITEMIEPLTKRVEPLLRNTNVMPIFKRAWQFGAPCTVFADYVAVNFGDLKQELAGCCDEIVDLVMRSVWFSASTEEVERFLLSRGDPSQLPTSVLVNHLPLEKVQDMPGFDAGVYRDAVCACVEPMGE